MKTNRGSTLVYHSWSALDAGQTEGIYIPRAPGRTFCSPLTGPLTAGDRPSLCQVMVHTLSDHHAI